MIGVDPQRDIRVWISDSDRELTDKSKQTRFYIRPKTARQANLTLRDYTHASKEGRGGQREFIPGRLNKADDNEWLRIIVKIENWFPTPEAYESGQGVTIEEDDVEGKLDVLDHLSVEAFNAMLSFANEISSMSSKSEAATRILGSVAPLEGRQSRKKKEV